MTRPLYAFAVLLAAAAAHAQPTDPLLSEYVEGSSFNKAVELYNGTGAPIDLSAYTLELYSNGSPTVSQSATLSGTLPSGAVFVAAHPRADAAVLAVADLTDGSVVNFNGDDAVVLRKGGAVVDAIGQVGVDPGDEWGTGVTSTQNNTVRRKAASCTGDTDAGDPFDPAALYDGFDQDTFDGLGTHTASCGGGTGNAAPTFTSVLTDRTVAVGEAFSFTYAATDTDGDALTFALTGGPTGATLDPSTGEFAWTPTGADAGQAFTVTVTASDGAATATTSATLTVPGAPTAGGTVFFSEYVEGSSNNKAVEVFNGTGADLPLDGYELRLYFNGGISPSTISLSGTLAAGDVYVVAHSSADAAVLAVADLTTGALTFNGDDAVALSDGTDLLDVIGQIGSDPGDEWGTGVASTQNNTVRRKAASCTGDPDGSDPFDPAVLYVGFEQDAFGGLGAHTASCGGPSFGAALPNTLVDVGAPLSFTYVASDPEGDALTYTLLEGPAGATLDPTSGVFSWTPSTTGVVPVVVVASDGADADTTTAVVGVRGTLFPGQTGAELRASVRAAYAPAQTLGYDLARDVMYAEIDREPDGSVVGVYSGFSVTLPGGVDPSAFLAANGINAEHTWPQSKGAADEPGRSDIHNLFPTRDNVNSARSNKPLVEVPDAQTVTWYRLAESQTTVPTSDVDAWSESAPDAFEPREVHKGNAARAALYFFTVYEVVSDPDFLAVQRDDFLDWVALDPADGDEVERTYEVSLRQGNVNPFLLDPTLAARVVVDLDTPPPPPVPTEATVAEARALPDGALVTVTGVVTRAEGRLTRLQDDTAGIAVFETFGPFRAAVDAGDVAEGDSLRVTGELTTFNGLREIEPSGSPSGSPTSFEVLSRGNALPAPVRLTLAEIAAGGEAYESELVRVDGLTVEVPPVPGGSDATFSADTSYDVTDGTATSVLRTPADEDGLLDGEPVPDGTVTFIGVVSEFRGAYQLQPVLATDLQRLVACTTESPLSFDADGDGSPTTVTADDFDPTGDDAPFGEFVGVRNEAASGPAVDLSTCSFVVFDPFAEDVTFSAVTGGTVSPEAPYVLATQNGDQAFGRADVLTDSPGAFALVEGTATEGADFRAVLGRIVAAVVYDADRGLVASVGGGATDAELQAFAQALAAVFGGAVAGEDDGALDLALVAAPNPLSGTGSVSFGLAEAADVTVAVYDALGREVAVLAEGPHGVGRHTVGLSASSFPAGVYVVRVVAGAEAQTARVTVVR